MSSEPMWTFVSKNYSGYKNGNWHLSQQFCSVCGYSTGANIGHNDSVQNGTYYFMQTYPIKNGSYASSYGVWSEQYHCSKCGKMTNFTYKHTAYKLIYTQVPYCYGLYGLRLSFRIPSDTLTTGDRTNAYSMEKGWELLKQ